MNYILYDGASREDLLPFTYTRPVADIRIGVLSMKEKWEQFLGFTTTYLTEEYLEIKYPVVEFEENVYINASVLPSHKLVVIIQSLSENQGVLYNGEVIAFFAKKNQESVDFETYDLIDFSEEVLKLEKLTDIFSMNHKAIELDFNLLTKNRESEPISSTNNIIGKENVFLEKGVVMEFVTINASEGPVYIGKDTLLMEGSLIRGPFSLGANSVLKMGAKIYGGTTIGPNCTVGGEVKNVVFFGNSNKGHDGYLGNSVVGEWCNFGADTNCSNMKNNHNDIKLWNYSKNRFVPSGFRFCGLFLGDYSKLGINSMLNTGTVIGVSVNSFGAKFPKKFIPSFSWAGEDNIVEYTFDKAIDAAKKMSGLKNKEFIEKDALILRHVFELSKRFR